ncbi:MAG: RICIN domain-containing protein [Clostridia bacterium]|nr:RICIN domain-containing protein [Clostridia bacterium]
MKKKLLRLSVIALTLAILLPSAFAASEMIASVTNALDVEGGLSYTIDGKYIKGIADDTTVKELVSEIPGASHVIKSSGYRVADASRVGTGYQLVTDTMTYTLIVNGDANGDTYVTSKDIIRAKKMIQDGDITSEFALSLDFNKDGKLDSTDLGKVSEYVVENVPERAAADMPASDLGDDFYATIDLSYTDNSVGVSVDNNVVAMDKNDSSPSQLWHFTRNIDGSYFIENLAMGTVLDVAYSSSEYGTNVGVYTNVKAANQKWHIVEHDGGYIFLTKCADDRALDVYAGSEDAGANVQIYGLNYSDAQIFNISKVENVQTDVEGYFERFSALDYPKQFYANLKFGSRKITAAENGNACMMDQSQYWQFELQSDGTYKITSTYNGNVLDIAAAKMENFTNVQTYQSNDTKAQRWYIYIKNGYAILRSALDPKFVLDLHGGLDIENGNIQIYTYNDSAAQQFKITDAVNTLPAFKVSCPYNKVVYGRYHTLEEAKANTKDYLGQVVYDLAGNRVYNPCPSYMAAKILYNAKRASDFAAAHGFVYGHADINPGYNWQNLDINNPTVKDERCSSCDRLVDWALWLSGVRSDRGNVTTHGPVVYEQVKWVPTLGYIKITDPSQLKPGDLVFTTYDYTKPGTPGHAFICASNNMGGNLYLRYDHGAVERIRYLPTNRNGVPYNYFLDGKAPFVERIGTADQPTFYYAYRPID